MFRFTFTSRAVARTPLRSARCSKIETAFSSVNCEPNRGVPLRSEKRSLHDRQ